MVDPFLGRTAEFGAGILSRGMLSRVRPNVREAGLNG
jgi:hypothetical protein